MPNRSRVNNSEPDGRSEQGLAAAERSSSQVASRGNSGRVPDHIAATWATAEGEPFCTDLLVPMGACPERLEIKPRRQRHQYCFILDRGQIKETVGASRGKNSSRSPAFDRLLSRRTIMFGFQGGESADTVARKKGYMQDAQQRWDFMTNFDLSTIKNEVQLSSMVKERSGISETQANSDVQAWMRGKQF
jgi:hypothetical protein